MQREYLIHKTRGEPESGYPPVNPGAILADPLIDQLDLFADPARWPKKPWCTTDFESGLKVRSLMSALRRPFIQANPPYLRIWSLYDIDRSSGAHAWEDGNLPPPAWTSVNKANGHAHSAWGLKVPVLVEIPEARRAPLRYLAAVESCYRAALQSDSGFSGLITKNPAHPLWMTLRGPRGSEAYDLDYLAEWVDLDKHLPRLGAKFEAVGLGRNCLLFDSLRKWCYVTVRARRNDRNIALWQATVYDHALERNADFPVPLHFKEVGHIAKSVAQWVWARDPDAERRFRDRQRYWSSRQKSFKEQILGQAE